MGLKINSENYISIQGWMRTELNLSGNDLLVYAVIYSFSQDGESYFNGSLQYLADWCGATKQGVIKNIKNLTDKGLIGKDEHGYYANRRGKLSLTENDERGKLSLTHGKLSLINNINNKKENKVLSKDNNSTPLFTAKKKPNLYEKCLALITEFTDDTDLQDKLRQFFKVCSENAKEAGTPFYTNTFKGKLNKLKQLTDDTEEQKQIVLQTLDNGWNSFYELKQDKSYSNNKQVSSDMGFEVKRNKRRVTEGENVKGEKF